MVEARRARPKRTSIEVVRMDLKKCNLIEDLARDGLEWRNRIHVADPIIVRMMMVMMVKAKLLR